MASRCIARCSNLEPLISNLDVQSFPYPTLSCAFELEYLLADKYWAHS